MGAIRTGIINLIDEDNQHIVSEVSSTLYEINVAYIDNKKSDYDTQYVVSLVNFGECFFESDLNFIGEAIMKSSKIFGGVDAMNIQNAIAKHVTNVDMVEFELDTRKLVRI